MSGDERAAMDDEIITALDQLDFPDAAVATIRSQATRRDLSMETRRIILATLESSTVSGTRMVTFVRVIMKASKANGQGAWATWGEAELRRAAETLADPGETTSHEFACDMLGILGNLVKMHCLTLTEQQCDDIIRQYRRDARQSLPARTSREFRKVTDRDCRRMLEAVNAAAKPPAWKLLFTTIIKLLQSNGTRFAAFSSVRVKDIAFDEDGAPRLLHCRGARGNKRRPVVYVDAAVTELQALLKAHPARSAADFQEAPLFVQPEEYNAAVTCADDAQRLKQTTVNNFFIHMKKKLGLAFTPGPQSFRRQFVVDQAVQGVSLDATRTRVGHTKTSNLHAQYARAFDEQDLMKLAKRTGFDDDETYCAACQRRVHHRDVHCVACGTRIGRAAPPDRDDDPDFRKAQVWSRMIAAHVNEGEAG